MAVEAREQQAPDYDYYDAVEDEEEGGRGPILVVVALIVIAAFMGVVWVAYNQGVREGQRTSPPVLRADSSPLKEVPAEGGGFVAPHEGTRVFESMDGAAPEEPEQLIPPPEEPMAAAPLAPPPAVSAPIARPSGEAPAAAAPLAPPPTAVPPAPIASAPAAGVTPPVPAPEASAAAVDALDPAAPQFLVQVGSYKSTEEALQSWQKMKGKHEDLLKGFTPNVAAVELGDRGTFHRLRFGPFSDRDGANAVCQSLKERKQDCLIVKS